MYTDGKVSGTFEVLLVHYERQGNSHALRPNAPSNTCFSEGKFLLLLCKYCIFEQQRYKFNFQLLKLAASF